MRPSPPPVPAGARVHLYERGPLAGGASSLELALLPTGIDATRYLELHHFAGGSFLLDRSPPDDWPARRIGARAAAAALAGEARSHGAEIRTGCDVKGLLVRSGAVAGVLTDAGEIGTSRVVLAAGVDSWRLLACTVSRQCGPTAPSSSRPGREEPLGGPTARGDCWIAADEAGFLHVARPERAASFWPWPPSWVSSPGTKSTPPSVLPAPFRSWTASMSRSRRIRGGSYAPPKLPRPLQNGSPMADDPFVDSYYASLTPSLPEPPFGASGEQQHVWGRVWGSADEVGPLRTVLARRPGAEWERVREDCWNERAQALVDPEGMWYWLSREAPDLAKLRSQHEGLVGALEAEGVEVVFVEGDAPAHLSRPI